MTTSRLRPSLPAVPALRRPLTVLAIICVASLVARLAWLPDPCHVPCRSATDHLLIFDEDYYVNAARVIAGIHPPAGVPYAHSPLGDDPNAEHPQLAKLAVAGLIEWWGDGPWAWRVPSVLVGTLALLGMFCLVRAAGGGEWPAVGAAALMAADNLLLVHGRIFTLDIFAVCAMVWGAAVYLRGRPLLAGAIVGVGACTKMVAPYVLFAFIVYELLAWLIRGRRDWVGPLRRLVLCGVAFAAVLIALLGLLDAIAPPYADAAHTLVKGGPIAHLRHQFSYAAQQVSPHGPQGIASYPWQWLIDAKTITYLNIDPSSPAPGLVSVQPPVHFVGFISPPILAAGLLGLVLACVVLWRRAAGVPEARWTLLSAGGDPRMALLAVAWFIGTWAPFAVFSLIDQRTSYIYYMVVVMPALYLAGTLIVARVWRYRIVATAFAAAVAVAAVLSYPLAPL